MCKSKTKTDGMAPNSISRRTTTKTTTSSSNTSSTNNQSSSQSTSYIIPSTSNNNYSSSYKDTSSRTSTSTTSLSSLKDSLPETAYIYDFSEISTATNNFLSKRTSSSSSFSTWRCTLRGKDAVVIQRKFRRSIETSQLRERLSVICKSHHMSLIKLLGASISGDHIYLVYDYINGANLEECLRNPKNPGFTVLSNWIARMQVATDVAQGIEYIHHYTGIHLDLVHNHIESQNIIVTDPSLNAKICHFGTSELCGEIYRQDRQDRNKDEFYKRHNSAKFEGTRGYMSPEFQTGGVPSQQSDVFAFGVVLLELLSGEEPLKYKFDKRKGDYQRVSLIETAREAVEEEGRMRRWVDKRLKDSFPVDVAEKMIRVALECVDEDPDKRPDMKRVAGKISKLYLESRMWGEKMRVPTDFTVSFAGR